MSLICYPLPNEGQFELTDVAEAVFRYWANTPTSIGSVGKIDPGVSRWVVDLNQRAEIELELSEGGSYALFTEHTPEEFNSVMKNAGGDEILPLRQHYFDAGHTHDDTVGSVALEIEGDLDSKKLNDWFSVLLQTEAPNIFRMKGILSVKGSEERMVFQGFTCCSIVSLGNSGALNLDTTGWFLLDESSTRSISRKPLNSA